MKSSLLTAVLVASALVATAQAQTQKQSPSKQTGLGTPPTKDPLQPATSSSSGAAPTTPSGQGSTAFVGPNDACLNATPISGPGTYAFDTVGASTDGPAACGTFTNDVWFNFTATATTTYDVRTCCQAPFDTELAVYNTAACPVGAALVCDDDSCDTQSRLTFAATNASVYKIRVGGFNGANGIGNIVISVVPPPPAASPDLCGGATPLIGPGPYSFNNSVATTGAEGQTNSNCLAFGTTAIDNDVWFKWTATASGTAVLSLCCRTADLDTKVAVYNGAACPASQAIACNDDTCGYVSEVHFCAVATQQYLIQLGNYPGELGGVGAFSITMSPPGGSNDECTSATVLGPTGPYAFNNSTATTGCVGQGNGLCLGNQTTGIDNDLWYTWTATATGAARVTTCGLAGFDTKIAVYQGAGCPAGQAIGCNDDACALESSACVNVTNGQVYTIQIGTYPGVAGGAGSFDITIQPSLPPCRLDDGSSEELVGWVAGGEYVWIQRFGPAVGSTNLTSVQVAWGSAAFPGSGPGNTSPANVLLYDDPNDDGNPIDAVLVQQISTTVTNVDTDTFNTYPVTPVSLNGYFFVGAGMIHAPGQTVAPMDTSCVYANLTYRFGDNTGAAVDYTTPSANLIPPESMQSVGAACNLMVRAGCANSPMLQICLPGQSGIIPCPCGNPPAGTGLGCNNFGAGPADSGTLAATGLASLGSDSVVLQATGENNTSTTVFWTGKSPLHSTGVVHGAGVRCVTASLKRLYPIPGNGAAQASGGAISRPGGLDTQSVSARTASLYGAPIVSGETRYYFNIYRDPQAAGPCGNTASTVNLTNAGAIAWSL